MTASRHRLLLVAGVVALGVNLRPAALSVGPLLAEVREALGMSSTMAGLLTSLPVLAFAGFGAATPYAAARLGVHRLSLLALTAVAAGLATRAVTGAVAVFLLASVLALAGMAAANVVLPTLVRTDFPDQVGRMTAVYTTALAVGVTAASALTVPLAQALGSWRWGLGAWAVVAAVSTLPWLALVRHDVHPTVPAAVRGRIRLAEVARTRLGWAMALTFGLQSLLAYAVFGWFAQVYRDAGFTASTAGYLLGVITGVTIPISWLVPSVAARRPDHTWLTLGLVGCYPIGLVGLLVAPVAGAWAWAVLVGVGTGLFPLVLTQIGMRARTPAGTAALSGFAQSVGYLVAAAGPLGMGILRDLTGGWTWPLVALTALSALLAGVALVVARPAYLEDQLPRTTMGSDTGGGRPR